MLKLFTDLNLDIELADQENIESIENNDTWELVELLQGKEVIRVK